MRNGAKIGELARAARVGVQTVRYYERRELLPQPKRSPSGYRIYSREALDRLRFIRRSQAIGFQLEEIREILRIKYAGKSPCECVRTALKEKLRQVERQMAELARFRGHLRRTLARSRKLPQLPHQASVICPIIEFPPGQKKRKRGDRKSVSVKKR